MSEHRSHPAIQDGEAFATAMLPAIKRVSQAWDDKDRLLWWAAFFAHLGGFATADLGRDAISVIEGIVSKGCADLQRKHEN